MSISGSSVHKKIKEKIQKVESQSEELVSQLYQTEQNLTNLTAERENCYISLAAHYLPELDSQAIQTTLKEVREDVERVFREKQERRSTIEGLMKDNRKKNHKLEEEIDTVTEQIEQQAQNRDKTLKLISEDLQKDANYTQRDEEAKKAEARLQQHKKRVEEVEGESSKKLPTFEKSKIFSYFLRNGYGTTEYQRRGLRKRLDSWAAEKINFDENKKCYDFLKSMPEMMKQEVARRQEELDNAVLEMKNIESRVEKQHGLPEIVGRAEGLMNKRQIVIEKDKKQDEQYVTYVKEREEIDSKKDPYYIQAVQQIKSFLKGEKIADLMSKARQTKGAEDDRLLGRIDNIDAKIRELKDRAKHTMSDRDSISKKLDEIRGIEKRFRSRDYEGSCSYFPDSFDVNELLTGYILGKVTSSDITKQIDSSQATRTPSYHSSSDYSSSHRSSHSSDNDDDHSSSSGFGGFDSFSSGGGFGGGGFSSGSGF